MTVLEQIEEAYPAHVQRIKDLAPDWWFDQPPFATAGDALMHAFIWKETAEGHEYWERLAALHSEAE